MGRQNPHEAIENERDSPKIKCLVVMINQMGIAQESLVEIY